MDQEFTIMPSQGVIEMQSFQLISIRFKASKPGSYVLNLPCIVNGMQTEEMHLKLVAKSDYPKVGCMNAKEIHQ